MLWIKAFHIIFMTTWMAGIFYLPRLFVYHADAKDSISDERFKVMERKLYFGIATPGMLLTLIFGFWLWLGYGFGGSWLVVKLLLVVILVVYHVSCYKFLRDFKHGRNTRSHVFFRWFNEFPVILIIPIVILVVVKPF